MSNLPFVPNGQPTRSLPNIHVKDVAENSAARDTIVAALAGVIKQFYVKQAQNTQLGIVSQRQARLDTSEFRLRYTIQPSGRELVTVEVAPKILKELKKKVKRIRDFILIDVDFGDIPAHSVTALAQVTVPLLQHVEDITDIPPLPHGVASSDHPWNDGVPQPAISFPPFGFDPAENIPLAEEPFVVAQLPTSLRSTLIIDLRQIRGPSIITVEIYLALNPNALPPTCEITGYTDAVITNFTNEELGTVPISFKYVAGDGWNTCALPASIENLQVGSEPVSTYIEGVAGHHLHPRHTFADGPALTPEFYEYNGPLGHLSRSGIYRIYSQYDGGQLLSEWDGTTGVYTGPDGLLWVDAIIHYGVDTYTWTSYPIYGPVYPPLPPITAIGKVSGRVFDGHPNFGIVPWVRANAGLEPGGNCPDFYDGTNDMNYPTWEMQDIWPTRLTMQALGESTATEQKISSDRVKDHLGIAHFCTIVYDVDFDGLSMKATAGDITQLR